MEDNTNIGHDLKICPSGKNNRPTVIIVDEYPKSSTCDDGEKCDK